MDLNGHSIAIERRRSTFLTAASQQLEVAACRGGEIVRDFDLASSSCRLPVPHLYLVNQVSRAAGK
jgi:hypothetical protein